jgi:WhiB family transcriptional regulator, redox-sensing transcriptional regulator
MAGGRPGSVARRCVVNAGGQKKPPPVMPDWPTWMAQGACAQPGADPDAWFADDDRRATAAAVATCRGCPVRDRCLSHALGMREVLWGVWGGLTAEQRRGMTRARAA